jgi:Xaa-Pro aminopeptidase
MRRALAAIAAAAAIGAAAIGAAAAARADVAVTPAAGPDTYRARRARLEALFAPGEIALIRGAPPVDVEWDFPFRQASDFYYLTGVGEPGAALLLWRDGDGTAHDALLLPERDRARERWQGRGLDADSPAARRLGFERIAPIGRSLDEAARRLAGRAPAGEDGVRARIAAMRLVKDETEIALLRRAMRITGDALVEAMRSAEPGMSEREIQALVEYIFRREGAERPGYPSIVGSGPNSCVLHYSANGRVMEEGDLVVCDVGAEYRRYTADVTRTFPVSGRFTPEQRKVYDAVLRAQEAAIAAVRPGATILDVHSAAWRSLDADGLAKYFFHGTSHWLGLDVHDAGRYDAKLEPGMVLTVEPGAYIAEKALGVRIEDDVLVTPTGCEVLTSWIPRTADEIERLMAEKGLGNAPLRPYRPEAAGTRRGRF